MTLGHFYFLNSGGIESYIRNHISRSRRDLLFELEKTKLNSNIQTALKRMPPNAIICCHDAPIIKAILNQRPCQKIALFLHGDYPYYLATAKEFGLAVQYIICVTTSIQNKLPKYLTRRSFVQGPVVPQPQYISPPKQTQLLFIGRASRGKGAHLLPLIDNHIKTLHPSIKWNLIIGHSHEQVPSEFQQWLTAERSRITLHSQITNDEVQSIITESTALILPSKREGHPMAVAETISHGRPCFTLEYSPDSWRHIPMCPYNIVKPSRTADELATVVIHYLSLDKQSQTKIEENNITFANTVYSKENKRNKLEQWTNTLIKEERIIRIPLFRKIANKMLMLFCSNN